MGRTKVRPAFFIFTAPEREGLYQIYAQVRGNPEERANAFVIVKAEEVPDGPGGV